MRFSASFANITKIGLLKEYWNTKYTIIDKPLIQGKIDNLLG